MENPDGRIPDLFGLVAHLGPRCRWAEPVARPEVISCGSLFRDAIAVVAGLAGATQLAEGRAEGRLVTRICNRDQLGRGFAHGFLVLSKEAVFTYKVDNLYAPQHEASIRWNDETVGIKWPIDPKDVVTSEKDLKGKSFAEADVFE